MTDPIQGTDGTRTLLGRIPGVHGFLVGGSVAEAENARDQPAAFTAHVLRRRRPELTGGGTATPDPRLDERRDSLRELAAAVR